MQDQENRWTWLLAGGVLLLILMLHDARAQATAPARERQCVTLAHLALTARALAESSADRRLAAEVLARMAPTQADHAAATRLAAHLLDLAYRNGVWPENFADQFESACLAAARTGGGGRRPVPLRPVM